MSALYRILFVLYIIGFSVLVPILAQADDQRITLVTCSEGTGDEQTSVSIETGGQTGPVIYARIDRGSFHSGNINVELFGGISVPEVKTYLDAETCGNHFRLSYDFINKDQFAILVFQNDIKTAPSSTKLLCVSGFSPTAPDHSI